MALWRAKDKPPVELVVANYDIIATSPEQAERIARDRFGWNFTVNDVEVEFKDIGGNKAK